MRSTVCIMLGLVVYLSSAAAEPVVNKSGNDDLKAVVQATAFPAELVIKAGVVQSGHVRLIRKAIVTPETDSPATTTPLLRLQKRNLLGQQQRPATRIHVGQAKNKAPVRATK